MSEADLVEIATLSRMNFAFIVTQIIAIHFAIIAGVYLFLNRAGVALKVAVLVIYTLGYAGLFGMYLWEQDAHRGLTEAILALPDQSAAGAATVSWATGLGEAQEVLANVLFAAAWFIIAIALFAPTFRRTD